MELGSYSIKVKHFLFTLLVLYQAWKLGGFFFCFFFFVKYVSFEEKENQNAENQCSVLINIASHTGDSTAIELCT